MSIMAFLFTVVGMLALLDYWNAEVIFWTRTPIQSETGQIIWIIVSGICFVIFSILAIREFRKNDDDMFT